MAFIDGTKAAQSLQKEMQREVAKLRKQGMTPKLVAILVGNDPASQSYVAAKKRMCENVGILAETVHLDERVTTETVVEVIHNLNRNSDVDAILVQLPLPKHVSKTAVLNAVEPAKDVDGFHPVNVGLAVLNSSKGVAPCTPAGIVQLLKRAHVTMAGRHAVIVGRSDIVGKPLACLLLHEDATVTVCHSRTPRLEQHTSRADILVAAIGKPGFIQGRHIRKGAVVVDVGVNRISDKRQVVRLFGMQGRAAKARMKAFQEKGYVLAGDVHPREGQRKARAITPVPGGVGPMTVAMLARNTISLAVERRTALAAAQAAASAAVHAKA